MAAGAFARPGLPNSLSFPSNVRRTPFIVDSSSSHNFSWAYRMHTSTRVLRHTAGISFCLTRGPPPGPSPCRHSRNSKVAGHYRYLLLVGRTEPGPTTTVHLGRYLWALTWTMKAAIEETSLKCQVHNCCTEKRYAHHVSPGSSLDNAPNSEGKMNLQRSGLGRSRSCAFSEV
jgi:hypothetical protein